MKILHTTPAQDGFYMPAEFAPHEGCLMIWPERADSWQYGAYAARKAFLRVIETISESESMTVLCSEGQYDNARAQLPDRVRLVVMETDDAWARDVGPTFVINGRGERRPTLEQARGQLGNRSDDGVAAYTYDAEFLNDGSLEELPAKVHDFLQALIER